MVGRIHLKQGGAWKEPSHIFVKDGGAWKDPIGGWKKVSGTWEQFYPQPSVPPSTLDLDFIAMSATGVLDPRITFSRASLATYFDSAGLLRYAADNIAGPSEDFSNGTQWQPPVGAITVNATTAPNGTLTADRLNQLAAGPGVSVTNPTDPFFPRAIFSVYAKAGTKTWMALSHFPGTSSKYCYFNLTAGTVGSIDTVGWITAGIQDVGGGWYRCWGMLSTLTGSFSITLCEVANSVTCTSPGDIYIWGAQFEHTTIETAPRAYLPAPTSIQVHVPRFDYDPVTHASYGLLIEEARTNVVVQNRDLTNAVWIKTNCAAVKDQIGIDGAAGSATKITASAANGTCLQSIPLASSARYQSAYVKRLAGSGVVNMTMNGGATWTPVTVTSRWTQVAIPPATLTNLNVGFQLVTSGDAIAVDFVQNENGAFATSPILVSIREADIAVMTGTNFSSWYNQSVGAFVAKFDVLATNGTRGVLAADNNTTAEMIRLYGSGTDPKVTITDNSVIQADLDLGTLAANTTSKLGMSYAANDIAACFNSGTVGTDTAATLPTPTQLRIGTESVTAGNILDGHIRRIQFWGLALSDVELQAATAADLPLSVTITSGTSFSVFEMGTAVTTLMSVSDLPVTWSLIGGADQAKFSIDAYGFISFNTAPVFAVPTDADGNNVYVVQARATDGITSATATINVTVTALPLGLPSLRGWYKADALTGADNSALASWPDASGRNNHATGSNSPTLQTAEQNGLNVVQFIHTSSQSFLLPNLLSGATAATAIAVLKSTTTGQGGPLWVGPGSGGGTVSHYPYLDGNVYDCFGTDVRKTVGAPAGLSSWHLASWHSASGSWKYFKDGTQVFTTATNTVAFVNQPQIGIGGSSYYLSGMIGEIIIANAFLTDAERQRLEGYLAHKWGIAGSLPVGHPYKSAPP